MLIEKKHITPTKSALIYHILRTRIVSMLNDNGINILQGDEWHFEPLDKKHILLVLKGTVCKNVVLNIKYDYLSGRTKFTLYESPNGKSYIGVTSNDIKYINCKECSGRRFTIDGDKIDMIDNNILSVAPCSSCNDSN